MKEKKIAIVDYGMGNLRSIEKALEFVGAKVIVTDNAEEISNCRGIVLPGVGAFPDAMGNIKRSKIDLALKKVVEEGTPLLGICLGMQLMFEKSNEIKETEGLGFLKGRIEKIKANIKIPHMGWNDLIVEKPCEVLKNVTDGAYVYFVHSFYAHIEETGILNAYCQYGIDIPAVVSKGNIFGLQFHPEKSGEFGMKMLRNFWEMM